MILMVLNVSIEMSYPSKFYHSTCIMKTVILEAQCKKNENVIGRAAEPPQLLPIAGAVAVGIFCMEPEPKLEPRHFLIQKRWHSRPKFTEYRNAKPGPEPRPPRGSRNIPAGAGVGVVVTNYS